MTRSVSLLFGGDFSPRGRYETLISSSDGDIFGDARDVIADADFTLFNLETPVSAAGRPITKVGPAFRAHSRILRALTGNGVDAVCLANNHIYDYGKEGLAQTLEALDHDGIQYVGAGIGRKAAESPLRIEVNGSKISIFSFAEREFNISEDEDGVAGAAMLDPLRIVPLILSERDRADSLIVCVHCGNEYFSWPRPGLRRFFHFLIEIGVDTVISHHPHVPGPYEIYNGKPIFYSLGNLVFDSHKPPQGWNKGYLARLTFDFDNDRIVPELIPYTQSVEEGGVNLMKDAAREEFLSEIEHKRDVLENQPSKWLAAWESFVRSKQHQAFIDLSSPIRFPGLRRLLAFRVMKNLIARPSRQLHRLNLLRCDSHRELTIAAIEMQIATEYKK